MGSRPRLDTRTLGVVALVLTAEVGRGSASSPLWRPDTRERFEGLTSWATPTFEVTDSPIEIGLDGETLAMDSPLRFSIRKDPVRVRLPKHAIGYSPAARSITWRAEARELRGVALGHSSRFDTGS